MNTTKIETEARNILRTDIRVPVKAKSARQGDVTIRPLEGTQMATTPDSVAVLAEGAHGSHVALGDLLFNPTTMRLDVGAGGCTIVHTDEPTARHNPIALDQGCYQVGRLRELSAVTLLPEEVKD